MPSSTEKQRRYIFFLRNKYGSKDKAPEKYKFAFEKGWEKLQKENVEFIKPYKRFFTEMSPPNVTYIKLTIKDEIKKADLRLRSDREHKDYHRSYKNYLEEYYDGEISPGDVAERSYKKVGIYDDSPSAGEIEAARFIMNVIRKSIED